MRKFYVPLTYYPRMHDGHATVVSAHDPEKVASQEEAFSIPEVPEPELPQNAASECPQVRLL